MDSELLALMLLLICVSEDVVLHLLHTSLASSTIPPLCPLYSTAATYLPCRQVNSNIDMWVVSIIALRNDIKTEGAK